MNLYKKNIRVLVIEPSNQQPKYEKARPNGTLGPAYIVGSLRKHGIETDYLDATVGQIGRNLKETFYLRNIKPRNPTLKTVKITKSPR